MTDTTTPLQPVYDVHIFVCTNQRGPDAPRRSCGETHGMELVSEFKKQLKTLQVRLKTRAQKAGCLDICDFGPTIVIYPEGTFYVNVQKEDVAEIVESHILNKKPVERLLFRGRS